MFHKIKKTLTGDLTVIHKYITTVSDVNKQQLHFSWNSFICCW